MPVATVDSTKRFVPQGSNTPYFERYIYLPIDSTSRSNVVNYDNERYSDSQTFLEGVRFGRRLQREEDRQILSKYRESSYALKSKYEEEIVLRERYRAEAEALQEEISHTKLQLMSLKLAFDELALSYAEIRSASRRPSGPSRNYEDEPEDIPWATPTTERHDNYSNEQYDYRLDSLTSPSVDTIDIWNCEDDFDVLQQVQLIEELEMDYVEQFEFPQRIDESRYEKVVPNR